MEHGTIVADSECSFEVPELPAVGERNLPVPLIFEVLSELLIAVGLVKVLSELLTAPGGVVTAISELLIAAVGVVSVVGLRIDSWLAVKVDLVIDIGCVVAVEFEQGTVIALVNAITEEGKANSVDVLLALTVEIGEVEVCSMIATGSSGWISENWSASD